MINSRGFRGSDKTHKNRLGHEISLRDTGICYRDTKSSSTRKTVERKKNNRLHATRYKVVQVFYLKTHASRLNGRRNIEKNKAMSVNSNENSKDISTGYHLSKAGCPKFALQVGPPIGIDSVGR